MGLLTELLSYELPENQAWRALAIEAPPGHGDLAAALVLFMERAIDYHAAALPLNAGSLADRELLRRHRALNRERGTGPGQVRSGRDGLIHSLIDSAVGPAHDQGHAILTETIMRESLPPYGPVRP